MTKSKNLNIKINLRTRGIGITFDGPDLHLTAVHNKMNQVHYLGHEILADFESKDDEEIRDFFEEFQSVHRVNRGDCFLGLPRDQVQVQVADFPKEARGNLEEVMEYQLPNYFPGDLEQFSFFPQVIGEGENLKVMIVAVPREILGHAFGFIRRWKLKLSGVSLDTFTAVTGLAKLNPNLFATSRVAILRGLKSGLELVVCNEGRLETTHLIRLEEEVDEDVLINNLEQGFGLARLDPNEIEHFLWAGQEREELYDWLQETLSIPFETWRDALDRVVEPRGLVGLGAAVCSVVDKPHLGLNMLPENLRKRQKRLPVILASALLIIAGLFFIVSEVSEYSKLKSRAATLNEEHSQLLARMNEISDASAKVGMLSDELNIYKRYRVSNLTIKMLSRLAEDLPDDTYLSHVQIKNGSNLTIQGESDNPFEVQKILTNIPFLKNVKLGNAITAGRNKNGKRRFMYRAELNLEALW